MQDSNHVTDCPGAGGDSMPEAFECEQCGAEFDDYALAPEPHICVECRSPDDDAPHVCPGCHAVGAERCAPGCIDDEIAREREHAIESGDYDRMSDDEEDPS